MSTPSSQQMTESVPSAEDKMNLDSTILGTNNGDERALVSTNGSSFNQQQHQTLLSSLPENRFELELEFIQALSSPAYIHFLATSRTLDDSLLLSSSSSLVVTHPQTQQSTLQQLQPFLHYLYETYSQPEYARFLRYPHALFFLESLLVYDDDHQSKKDSLDGTSTNTALNATTSNTKGNDTVNSNGITNKLWVEWTVPSFRNFCHQQQFLAWQHRHSTCYGVGSIATMNTTTSATNNNNDDTNLQQEIAATGLVDENDDMDDDDDDDNQE